MSFLKIPVFFWSPCQISCLGKLWFIQKWVPSDRDWRTFAIFDHFEWTTSQKVHVWAKWFFGYWKRYLRTTYLENLSHRAAKDHEIRPPRFLQFLNDPKKIFEKFLFFTQNRSIRVKNMFSRFSIFFPK